MDGRCRWRRGNEETMIILLKIRVSNRGQTLLLGGLSYARHGYVSQRVKYAHATYDYCIRVPMIRAD